MVVVASAGGKGRRKGIIWYIRTYQHDLYLLVVVVYNVDIYILVDQTNTQQRRGMLNFRIFPCILFGPSFDKN